MASSSLILNSFYLLNILIFSGAHGVNIQFFMHNNFTGLFYQSNSTAPCNDFSTGFDKKIYVQSIQTDTCFIYYWRRNCTSSPATARFVPGKYSITDLDIGSFRICNEVEDGNQLNIDITNHNRLDDSSDPRVVLESYRNVCSCINVPKYVQNRDTWAIDNHHDNLYAYYEPDCSKIMWNPVSISAGYWWDNNHMHEQRKINRVTDTTYKIQSLGPEPRASYFQLSCNSSKVTTKVLKTYESTTESTKDVSFQINEGFQTGAISRTTTSTYNSESKTEGLRAK